MVKLKDAAKAFKALNGIICVYKPPGVHVRQVQKTIVTHLCRELNELPDRPIEQRVEIVGPTNAPMEVRLVPNLADHPLVTGPRYIAEDFKIRSSSYLGLFTSGVLLLGINEGTKISYHIHVARPTRAYKVHGQLGKGTDTYFWNGKTIERATYNHVTREKIDGIVAHMQAAHQKTMFDLSGVHMDSQAAYEMASQGVMRPASSNIPVVYGIKCVHFDPPNFTLEIQAVNEYEKYLWTIIHDLGVQLKTVAHCTGVQCIRQAKFDLELALLRKHWRLEYILENMQQCQDIIENNQQLMWPQTAKLTA